MRWILGRGVHDTLARFARRRLLVGLDYDGTLAPIVDGPARAAMRARTRAALRRVAARYPCVVISGRTRGDLLRRLRGLGLRRVIGNHGAEPSGRSRVLRARVRRWRESLAPQLAGLRGVTIEDKGLSLSIHYRGAADPVRARETIREAASRLRHARTLGGKCVVNVLPYGVHKGTALESERIRLGCVSALYVGDDETDEDAFAGGARRRLGIRVSRDAASRARYYLRDQAEVDALLEALVRLRPDPRRVRGRGARRRPAA